MGTSKDHDHKICSYGDGIGLVGVSWSPSAIAVHVCKNIHDGMARRGERCRSAERDGVNMIGPVVWFLGGSSCLNIKVTVGTLTTVSCRADVLDVPSANRKLSIVTKSESRTSASMSEKSSRRSGEFRWVLWICDSASFANSSAIFTTFTRHLFRTRVPNRFWRVWIPLEYFEPGVHAHIAS